MTRWIQFSTVLVGLTLLWLAGCSEKQQFVHLDVAAKPAGMLSEYHFFKEILKDLKPNEQVLPYDLASPLFSDYAWKARFVYVPGGKKVAYNDTAVLDLPVGSCYIKTFYYPNDFRHPEKGRRILETRLLVHRASGWEALDYIWNEDQTDAVLDVAGDVKEVAWIDEKGQSQKIDYIIPNKNQCKGCHWYANAIMPIGPKVRNLNHDFQYDDGKLNQLTKWQQAGILEGAPAREAMPVMCRYDDEQANLDERARAYLDINCAHCHNAKGPAYTSGLFLDYRNADPEHLGICKTPVAAGRGTGNHTFDIVPGDPENSILYYRMASTDAGIKMPELGRTLVHQEGVALIEKWIRAQSGGCQPAKI
ncbi:MAG: SO2930 family diheme c-type cytochrome [Chitinophagales bacterium]